uniref:HTH myb-type domain-containing protein n=1 Tax=Strongyloides papillosus TaxID=174720 RepID=A0A0N5CBY6_STREA
MAPWTNKEIETLKKLMTEYPKPRSSNVYAEMSEKYFNSKRSPAAIKKKMIEIENAPPIIEPTKFRRWTEEEDEILKNGWQELANNPMNFKEKYMKIAEKLEVRKWAGVKDRIKKLGLRMDEPSEQETIEQVT